MARRHRLFLPEADADAPRLTVTGADAEHARKSRRAAAGDLVTVLTGRGLVLETRIAEAKRDLELEVLERREEPRVTPGVEVFACSPKGTRLNDMIDALSQVGAASWTPLTTKYSVVEPRPAKLGRMERVAVEAAKQCERAWTMEVGEQADFEEALRVETGAALVLADAGGEPYERIGARMIRLLVGPEGGFTEGEIARARKAGAKVHCFGVHTMRIEVAAPTATAVILDHERR